MNRLPSGWDNQMTGAIVYLLPYIEQDNQFKLWSFNGVKGNGQAASFWWQDPLNRPPTTGSDVIPRPPSLIGNVPAPAIYASEAQMKVLQCPSAKLRTSETTVILYETYFSGTSADFPPGISPFSVSFSGAPGRLVVGHSNYVACGGNNGFGGPGTDDPTYIGLFSYNSRNSLGAVPDGTSNTFMFLEYVGGYVGTAGPPFDGWWGGAFAMGPIPLEFGMCPDHTNPNCDFNHQGQSWATPGTFHTGNAMQVCYGDGSVRRLIVGAVDFGTLLALGGMQDGIVVTSD
ncbi:MAG TPA: DUF1559 domain-containing protein, partial [Gemmataceae bacterium]|nr:DUF1559 domain-containing protein [Gemmataceae bacterium]